MTKENDKCLRLSKELLSQFNNATNATFREYNNSDFGKCTKLFFAHYYITSKKQYRDFDKNLVIPQGYALMYIDCDINKAGVGDGQEPAIARTYTINVSFPASVRPYRCKHFYNTDGAGFHVYDRTMAGAIEKAQAKLHSILTRYPQLSPRA